MWVLPLCCLRSPLTKLFSSFVECLIAICYYGWWAGELNTNVLSPQFTRFRTRFAFSKDGGRVKSVQNGVGEEWYLFLVVALRDGHQEAGHETFEKMCDESMLLLILDLVF